VRVVSHFHHIGFSGSRKGQGYRIYDHGFLGEERYLDGGMVLKATEIRISNEAADETKIQEEDTHRHIVARANVYCPPSATSKTNVAVDLVC
jgi:hypothetical protein